MRAGHAAALERRVGGDRDDPPGTARPQQRSDGTDPEKGSAQVRREHVIPLLDRDLEEVAKIRASGAADERVQLADLLCRRDRVKPGRLVADVETDRRRPRAQLARKRLRAREVDIAEHDGEPVCVEPPRDRGTEAARRSRDDHRPHRASLRRVGGRMKTIASSLRGRLCSPRCLASS